MLAIYLSIPVSPCISTGHWKSKELCRTHVPQPTCVRVFQAITAQASNGGFNDGSNGGVELFEHWLGGGNSNISWNFHPELWGRWNQFDEHIFFQMGWFNHQLDKGQINSNGRIKFRLPSREKTCFHLGKGRIIFGKGYVSSQEGTQYFWGPLFFSLDIAYFTLDWFLSFSCNYIHDIWDLWTSF